MSNPDNALGTNGAYGGRTSVNAFNDVMASFKSRGILSGWACAPSSGLKVTLGGDGTTRDVAIAEDNSGNKTSVNNISQAPVEVTMPAAPANNSRVDSIVAYIESSPSSSGETDNYTAVNLLTVSGSASATPTAPSDSDIRTAITADGASGPTAYYVVLANVNIASGTTDIDASMISAGASAQLTAKNMDFSEFDTMQNFLPDSTSIINYSYTVPSNIKMAWVNIYIDMANATGAFRIALNDYTMSYVFTNTRGAASMIVKGGDVIKVVRTDGTATPFHNGYLRKIF